MNKSITLLMCVALLMIGVACTLSTSAGASVELTQSNDNIIPTATTDSASIITEEASIESEEPASVVVEQPANNNNAEFGGQLPATAVLPEVTLPLIDPVHDPHANACVVRPAQAGTLVNIRRGADLGYEAIMQLKTWAFVKYEVNGWYGINIDQSYDGFVSSTVTKLQGDCYFLHPTPIPTRDSNNCYLDIPLAAGIEVPYFNEPQAYGNQKQGMMSTVQMQIRGEKAGWYVVINYKNVRGWVPARMGITNGNCNNISSLPYDGLICIIVATYEGNAYRTPFTGSDKFGTVAAGDGLGAVVQTVDRWFGFEPGIPQAPNDGLERLRWVYPSSDSVFREVGDCLDLPVVYDKAEDWDLIIAPAGEPPTDSCYVQSFTQPFVNHIFTGIDDPQVIGVLNTYCRILEASLNKSARFVAIVV